MEANTPEIKARILGRLWRVTPSPGLIERYGTAGECDNQTTRKKAIRYDPDQPLWDLLETIIHESHHAAFPDCSEDSVETYNRDVRRILERLFDIRLKAKKAKDEPESKEAGPGNSSQVADAKSLQKSDLATTAARRAARGLGRVKGGLRQRRSARLGASLNL